MFTFATFGAGFLMRPLGAIFLGAWIDHHGRRSGLLVTLGLMAVGTFSIACTPWLRDHWTACAAARTPGQVVAGNFGRGRVGRRIGLPLRDCNAGSQGFYTSWQSATQQLAVVCAALIGLVLHYKLSAEQMDRWGWRIPLLAGCAIRQRTHRPSMRVVMRSVASHWQLVGLGMMMTTMVTVSFSMITAYTPTFGSSVLHLGAAAAAAGLHDLNAAGAFPAMLWLVSTPSIARLLGVELWLSLMFGGVQWGDGCLHG
jgi:MFS family permease